MAGGARKHLPGSVRLRGPSYYRDAYERIGEHPCLGGGSFTCIQIALGCGGVTWVCSKCVAAFEATRTVNMGLGPRQIHVR